MKKFLFFFLAVVISLSGQSVFSQSGEDAPALNLPGDNLDLYAVLTLFQKSKTIEEFETALNKKETGINNLDLNLDKKVDFIKVTTTKKDNSFTFVLQDAVSKSETQDVAVILVNKDKNGKVSIQCVGDEDLYGKDYVIEPKSTPAVTANPGYQGSNPVTVNVPATTVVVESAPIVQYVYSPAYVPYYPPYYYGYYPPYFAAFTVLAVGIYRHNNWYHGGYYGGHYSRNTVIINNNNRNSINHYNNNRNRSNTVANNNRNGRYGNGNRAGNTGVSNRMSNGSGNRASAGTSDRKLNGSGNRASTGVSDRSANRPSAGTSDRGSSFDRPSTSNRSSSNFNSGGRTRSGGSSFSGGGGGFHGGGGGGFGGGGRRR
ncbi:hypothetical protein BD847_2751 [Flavobacterium cutihirudinis]|uniref:DUF3300 domain-containing protein n=1 Tax=Flavobacterium cutihirudinis TaxID=1265740 RepID=A0A3D9FT06_9FLAO|nr:hypothetical protein [Flavobacterium cutihirudinis]RED23688.1 hypothetical protein BD847_2751 [Flavobacterium cutihirudinis]